MGVYGLAWTPAFIFETIWTPGPNFGSKGPLAPNLKIAIFSQNLTIWVSMDLPGPQHSYLRQFGPRGPILGPRALWPQNSKICNFLTKPHNMDVYRLTWTPAFIFEVIWTLGPNFGSKGPLAPNYKNAISPLNQTTVFYLNCRSTSHLPLTWATTKLVTIMSP